MKRSILIAAFAFLVIVNVTALGTIAFHRFYRAESPPPHDPQGLPPGPGHSLYFLRQALSLTDEQLSRMREQRILFGEQMEQIQVDLDARRKALMQALKASEPDKTLIYGIVKDIGMLQLELEKQGIENMLRHRDILTPEQYEKFLSMFEHHFNRQGCRRRHGPMGGKRRHWMSHEPESDE